jgi:hypothetical protein
MTGVQGNETGLAASTFSRYWVSRIVGTIVLVSMMVLLASRGETAGDDPSKIPVRGTPETKSIGQPARTRAQWGPALGYDFSQGKVSGRLNLGLNAELLLPQMGFLDFTVEGSVGMIGSQFDGAVSSYLTFPYLNPGLEYNFPDQKVYFKLTAIGAPRRGGMFGMGDRIRVDWIPAKQLVQLGFAIEQPFGKYRRNRPMDRNHRMQKADVSEARGLNPNLVPYDIISAVNSSVDWMDVLLTPELGLLDPASDKDVGKYDKRANVLKAHIDETGRGFNQEDSLYHENLTRAFTHTVGGDRERGEVITREAERILLDAVVIPTNRHFGRLKKPVDLSAYINNALFEFGVALGRENLTGDESAAAVEVLRSVLLHINEVAKSQKKRWNESRMVWLPLNYGLRPEQYDSQAELDAVFERLVAMEFTQNNDIGYLFNDDFYYFYKNLLLETEYYQVTIIHDFRNKSGPNFDHAAWGLVADGYIEAFIRAIEEMDRGERDILPEFILFLDEYYYRANRSWKIISFLEELSTAEPVSVDDRELQDKVRGQQQRLQHAIANSTALDRFGKDYVKRNVKVHINITHQYDPVFKEDVIARDHRKIAFRDIFEEDPESGVAIFTGEGIGEQYLGPTWEDRSLLLQGPDLVKLKNQTRQLFLYQGYNESDVPFYLKPRPFPDDYADRCARLRYNNWTTSALTAMNQPGFREKTASVARMAIYNLMPRGSVMLVPDSIWASDFWASCFVAIALRGVHVYAVAPSQDHAPSAAGPTLELIRESLAGMLHGGEIFGDEIHRAGGSLHVGVFATDIDVCNPLDRVEVFLASEPDSHLVVGGLVMDPGVREVLVAEREFLLAQPDTFQHITDYGEDRKTKLHQKTQFFATAEGIEILKRPEWTSFLTNYLAHHRKRCQRTDRSLEGIQPEWLRGKPAQNEAGGAIITAFEESLGQESEEKLERVAYFLTIGSLNQDRRGMLLDGEVVVTVSGYESLVTIMDFAFILTATDWLETSDEVDQHYPRQGGLLKTVTRWIHNLI